MDRLLASCEDAKNFPGNLVYPNIYPYSIDDYVKRLAEQQNLFLEKGEAALDFWEYDFEGHGMSLNSNRRNFFLPPYNVAHSQFFRILGFSC